MNQYMICACDGGEPLSLIAAENPEEALDEAKFDARIRCLEVGYSAVKTAITLLPWTRAYAMEISS